MTDGDDGGIDTPGTDVGEAVEHAHAHQGVRLLKQDEPLPEPTGPDELFEDMGELLRTVFVPGRRRPFLVGPIPPVLLDWINKIQERGPVIGKDQAGNPIYGEPDRVGFESKIVAAGLRDPATKRRMYTTHEQILATAARLGDAFFPGWIKTLTTEILLACRFGPARSYADLKNGSGSTLNGSTSSASASSTSETGPSESAPDSATDGNSARSEPIST